MKIIFKDKEKGLKNIGAYVPKGIYEHDFNYKMGEKTND